MFRKYMHLEKFGTDAVQGIELGKTYIFPKIDGTNASVWHIPPHPLVEDDSPVICGGSRQRELSLDKDNAGFLAWLTSWVENYDVVDGLAVFKDHPAQRIYNLLVEKPKLRLYGEWLVPHTFKGYREGTWKKFYVFDVFNDETGQYLPYEVYQPLLEAHGIEYIPPLAIVTNGDYTRFLQYLETNKYLCPDEGEPGEGIVLKNYDFYNKFGDQVWAKIIRQEFKEAHYKAMGAPEHELKINEERIVDTTVSLALIDKEIAKICNLANPHETVLWTSKMIPRLLETVFYCVVKEELWDAWKEIGYGTINGKTLKALVINRIKKLKPELF